MTRYFCNHKIKPFNDNSLGEQSEPTKEQINIYRLWKCSDCKKWHSLIGVEKEGDCMKGFCPNDGYKLFQTKNGKLIRCLICGYTVKREIYYKGG